MKLVAACNRREFLKSTPRHLLLAGLAGLGVTGELKRRRLRGDPNCLQLLTCADCVELGGCTKAQATAFRAGRS